MNGTTALRHFASPQCIDLETFANLCSQLTKRRDYPLAREIASGIPVYEGKNALALGEDPESRLNLFDEWHRCLYEGPGVLVIKSMFTDTRVIDDASATFLAIIEAEKSAGAKGDHFAPSGSNDRIWNAFQKHGQTAPENFLAYYANPLIAWISEAWLGPHYQITSQVNVVNPGGQPQRAHRDYHLGFQDNDSVSRYPLPMQVASQFLTLQGAVAHNDMPLETGPTQLLPYSQQYPEGYLAYRDPVFREYFNKHAVQLPLSKGDGLFFNPALFHAAGENRSNERRRMANLLQVSSAFGRPMETVDTKRLIEASYSFLIAAYQREGASNTIQAFLTAVSEGYAFPANLDRTPPENGMAPESQRQLLQRALQQTWTLAELSDALQRLAEARLA